jgi:hypothetical protein
MILCTVLTSMSHERAKIKKGNFFQIMFSKTLEKGLPLAETLTVNLDT